MASAKARSTVAASGGEKPSSANRASACAANSSTRPSRKARDNDNSGNAPSCPLVLVEWVDSAQPIPGWAYLASFEPSGTIRCASVGWLIRDDDEMKALAPNMGAINDERSLQVSGVIQIPAGCVLRVTKLREPRPRV